MAFGMKKGDIIIQCNGRRIKDMALLMRVVLGNTEKRDMSIILERDGRRLEMLFKPGQIGIGGTEHNR
jgi:type II secretory pathway component PulC